MAVFELHPADVIDGEAILSLDEAKAHLSLEPGEDHDDALIAALRDAAIDMVQQYTMKALAPTEYTRPGSFGDGERLGVGPALSNAITAVSYLKSDGTSGTMVAADLRIGIGGRIELMPGKSWPSDCAEGTGTAVFTFTAGYAAGAIPPLLLAAAKLMLGALYLNREAAMTGTIAMDVPPEVMACCNRYRDPVI